MRRLLKIIGIVSLSIITVLFALSTTYVYKHYPRKIDSFEVNNSILNTKILIASQGSEFKNALLNNIVDKIDTDSTYIKVIDVSLLNELEPNNWNAVIIINTCIADKINKDVSQYLVESQNEIPKVLFITAGDGMWKPNNLSVDAISSASRMSKIENLSKNIFNRLSSSENIASPNFK